MIALNGICKQYGRRVLLVDASFQLNPGEKVGLVGPNGSGKTTVFRMIAGEEEPDAGELSIPKRTTVGYFRQDVEAMGGRRCSTRRSRAAGASATCITSSSISRAR
jgi:ATPase subunit of ABC transporter with duplicated ATPase domains